LLHPNSNASTTFVIEVHHRLPKIFDVKEEASNMDNDEAETDVETKENGKNSASEAFYEEFGLFGSPKLQYLEKKEEFLKEFLFPENWGRKGSKKRVVAINTVIKYLEDIKNLVDLYPLHLSGVESENVELFFSHCKTTGVRRLPIPSDVATLEKLAEIAFRDNKSREVALARLLTAFKAFRDRASDFYEWSEIDRVNNFEDYRSNRPPRSRNGFWSGEFPEEFFDTDSEAMSDSSFKFSEKVQSSEIMNKEKVYDEKESFSAMLKWLRWTIYQKIENRIYTGSDLVKYDELVTKFVSKFKSTQLSGWEIATWLNKVIKTKSDAHNALLAVNSEVIDSVSEMSSQESLSDQEFDATENDETNVEFGSVSDIFDKVKAYEELCCKLPDVPRVDDPNEVIELRLKKLKAWEGSDEAKNDSKTTNPDVKENKNETMKVEVFDNKTEANDDDKNPEHFNSDQPKEIFASDCQAYNSDVFEERKHFNDWFENELKKKQRKPKAGQAVETPGHNFYTNDDSHRYKQVYEGRKYEQLFTNSQDNHSKDINKLPDLLLYLQAYFVLLLSTCKTLNDQIQIISSLSQSPVIPFLPAQSPMPTPQTRPLSVAMYERDSQLRCHCSKASVYVTLGEMTSSASAVVSMWCKWSRLRLQNLKEKVILFIAKAVVHEGIEIVEPNDWLF
jgi:hypothetical protein